MLTLLLRGVSGSLDGVDIFWTPMLLMGASGSLGVNTFDSADIPCWSILPLLMLTRFLIFMISDEEDSMLELLAITALPVSKLLICLKGGSRLLRLSTAARSASAPLQELLPRR